MDKPIECMAEVFVCFPLEDFYKKLSFWQRLAMTNDESIYDNAATREELMDFCKELQRLVKAFYRLIKMWRKKKKSRGKIDVRHDHTKLNALPRVYGFCEKFSFAYAKMELLDLLDAVITYNGTKKVRKQNVVLFYECLDFMIDVAYSLSYGRQRVHQLKKTIGKVQALKV